MLETEPGHDALQPSGGVLHAAAGTHPRALEAKMLLVDDRESSRLVRNRIAVRGRQVQQSAGAAVVSYPAGDRTDRRCIQIVEQVPGDDRVETEVVLVCENALDRAPDVTFLLRSGHAGIVGQCPRQIRDVKHAGVLRQVADILRARRPEIENVRVPDAGGLLREQPQRWRLEHHPRRYETGRVAQRRPEDGVFRQPGSVSALSRSHRPRMRRT